MDPVLWMICKHRFILGVKFPDYLYILTWRIKYTKFILFRILQKTDQKTSPNRHLSGTLKDIEREEDLKTHGAGDYQYNNRRLIRHGKRQKQQPLTGKNGKILWLPYIPLSPKSSKMGILFCCINTLYK